MVNVSNIAEYLALATIQGTIVALPHPAALARPGRLRSPAWALVAPVAAAGSGWRSEIAASLLTALGCLTLGAALVRLTPARWLYLGVLSMAAVDMLLLALGGGEPAAALLRDAVGGTIQPAFDRAELGSFSTDYPDLVLAAVLGAIVADRAIQQHAAVLVAILAAAYGALFAVAEMLPATVPLALVLVLLEREPRLRPTTWVRRSPPRASPQTG